MAQYNLSYSTVSRALQDLTRDGYITRRVGSGTRVADRSRHAAESSLVFHLLGGVPSAAQKGLSIFRDLVDAAQKLGARIEPHEDLTQDGRAALVSRVLSMDDSSEGVVFSFLAGNRPHIDRLREAGAPYMVLDVPHPMPGYSIVLRDHRSAARVLVRRFLAAGHRPDRIGLILGVRDEADPDPHQWDAAKSAGAGDVLGAEALGSRRAEWQVAPLVEAGEMAARRLLARAPETSAIYCDNDRKAAGLLRELAARGMHVPRDISVACFNLPAADLRVPVPLACAWASPEGVGETAAKALWEMLTGRARPPVTTELPMRFEEGASIAAPRLAARR